MTQDSGESMNLCRSAHSVGAINPQIRQIFRKASRNQNGK